MTLRRAIASAGALVVLAVSSQGCVGIYDNTEKFLDGPRQGLAETDLLATYGFPDFTTNLEGGVKVYCYNKVRDVNYIVLVGLYQRYDRVVMVKDGAVTETRKVPRSKALAVFQPVPWAEAE